MSSSRSTDSRPPSSSRIIRPRTTKASFEDPEYHDQLVKYLNKMLSRFLNREYVEILLKDISLFVQAFTHRSFHPRNYEVLETIGDSVAKLAFYDYIVDSMPFIDKPSIYSELERYYGSNEVFGELAKKEGMDKFLRIRDAKIPDKVYGDIFESFLGALFRLGNKIVDGVPMGYNFAKNYFTLIFNDIEIDVDRQLGAFKNQLLEMASKFGIYIKTTTYVDVATGRAVITYYVSRKDLANLLKRLDLDESRISNFPKMLSNKIPHDQYYDQEVKKNDQLKIAFERRIRNPNETEEPEDAKFYYLLGQIALAQKSASEAQGAKIAIQSLADLGLTRSVAEEYQTDNSPDQIRKLILQIRPHYYDLEIKSSEPDRQGKIQYVLTGKAVKTGEEDLYVEQTHRQNLNFDEVKEQLYKLAITRLPK